MIPSLLLVPGAIVYMLFSPPQPYAVSREIMIRRPAKEVFGVLSDLRRQSEFNYFNLSYPQLSFNTVHGAAAGKQSAEWRSEHLVVTATVDRLVSGRELHFGLTVTYGIEFPLAMICGITEEERGQSRVTCQLRGNLRFHERHLLPPFAGSANQADPFADTLLNLKLLLEK